MKDLHSYCQAFEAREQYACIIETSRSTFNRRSRLCACTRHMIHFAQAVVSLRPKSKYLLSPYVYMKTHLYYGPKTGVPAFSIPPEIFVSVLVFALIEPNESDLCLNNMNQMSSQGPLEQLGRTNR